MAIEKELADYPGYTVNTYGEVFSYIRGYKKKLKQSLTVHGYPRARLPSGYKVVHRLVALTFVDNPYNYPQVNHIDGNKLNNSVANLEWCSTSQNMLHAYELSGGRNRLVLSQIKQIKQLIKSAELRDYQIAERFNCSTRTIGKIRKSQLWPYVEPVLTVRKSGNITVLK